MKPHSKHRGASAAQARNARILRGVSRSADPTAAVQELHAAIAQPDCALVCFFCAPTYPLDALGAAIRERFEGVDVVGCTTAGEITPNGYLDGSLTGLSLPALQR